MDESTETQGADPQDVGEVAGASSWVTDGSLHGAAWRLALPTIGVAAMEAAYALVDIYWVGKLGKGAIFAITIGAITIGVVRTFCMGITSACTALVAQAVGSRNRARAEKAIGQGLLIALFLSVVVAAIGVPLAGHFIRWFPAKAGVFSDDTLLAGTRYLQISLAGSFALLVGTAFAAALRGAGDTITPLVLMGLGLVGSIILDPLLILGLFGLPRWGVPGAAVAQVIGRAFAAGLLAWVFFMRGHHHFHLHLRDLKPDWRMIRTMFKIGVFGSAQALTRNLSGFALLRILTRFGEVAAAAHGIALRLRMSVMMPGMGFGVAAATLVGQNLGARNVKRAERAGWLVAGLFFIFATVVGIVFWFHADWLVGRFDKRPEVVAMGASFLRWFAISFWLMAFSMVLGRAMNGAGDTFWPMLLTGICVLGLRIPLAHVISRAWSSAEGVWAALAISIIAEGLLVIVIFHWGRWKKIGEKHVRAVRDASVLGE